jgi:hypothetical protein
LGVGREANNLIPEKNSIVQERNRGKNWSDLLERHGRGKGLKNEIWMATWNVLSLNRAGSLRKLKEELTKYVERMSEERVVKRLYQNTQEGRV